MKRVPVAAGVGQLVNEHRAGNDTAERATAGWTALAMPQAAPASPGGTQLRINGSNVTEIRPMPAPGTHGADASYHADSHVWPAPAATAATPAAMMAAPAVNGHRPDAGMAFLPSEPATAVIPAVSSPPKTAPARRASMNDDHTDNPGWPRYSSVMATQISHSRPPTASPTDPGRRVQNDGSRVFRDASTDNRVLSSRRAGGAYSGAAVRQRRGCRHREMRTLTMRPAVPAVTTGPLMRSGDPRWLPGQPMAAAVPSSGLAGRPRRGPR
jgi:hypothetical protein